jgi:hypothetical protein
LWRATALQGVRDLLSKGANAANAAKVRFRTDQERRSLLNLIVQGRVSVGIATRAVVAAYITYAATAAASGIAQTPAETTVVEIHGDSLPTRLVTAAELARLPRLEVRATAHGTTSTFGGVALSDVLRLAGVAIDSVRGRRVADYVVVAAADGYRAVFSLGELAPDLTGRIVLLADRRDGKPLSEAEGPLRLVLPDERRPTRWVRQVKSLSIRRATP